LGASSILPKLTPRPKALEIASVAADAPGALVFEGGDVLLIDDVETIVLTPHALVMPIIKAINKNLIFI
jgi:hypothetical protein